MIKKLRMLLSSVHTLSYILIRKAEFSKSNKNRILVKDSTSNKGRKKDSK